MSPPEKDQDSADTDEAVSDAPAADASETPRPVSAPASAPDLAEELDQFVGDDTDHLLLLAQRVGELHDRIATQTQSEVNGLFELLGSKRRLLMVNFMSGLARGAGFFLGVTLIGGLIIGGFAFFFDTTARAFGMNDVTFRKMMRTFAEEAIEAKKVWEDVNQKQEVQDPDTDSASVQENRSPPPPLEDG